MMSPTAPYVRGVAVFTSVSDWFCTAVTVSLSGFDVTVPLVAVAVFVTEPASRSACVDGVASPCR